MSNKAPKVSSTFEKATELETVELETVLESGAVGRDPDSDHGLVSSTRSSLSAPLSASGKEFSIRRGVVLGGRFRVTKLIGAGAQCFVYAAEHTTLKNQVAIKCLQPELVTPDLVDRFAREAQALTAIRNAHVAAVLDVGRAPCGTPFIVMEYLQGRDLSDFLEARPRLEARHATEIALQTCEGLAAAHALGLVHQDIKPSNIFLSDEMGLLKVKVVDFGVARVSIDKNNSIRPRFKPSKLDDTVGGTPFYMPPEQFFANSAIDPRSDIFSLGMVLYEMLRGTSAFDLEMSTRRQGAAVQIERSGIDPGLADVIERCLAQDPQERFDSVAELAIALLPYAPSRSRSHAEAAGALLRKAGLVTSTLCSSVPPKMPPSSQLPTMSIPPAAPLPSFAPSGPARSRAPRYAALGAVLLLATGVVAWRVALSPSKRAEKAAAQTPPPSAQVVPAGTAIGITPVQRGTGGEVDETKLAANGAAGSVAPSLAIRADAAAPKSGALPPAPPRGKALGGAAPASATAPKPAGTSEDLGF